MSSKVKNALHIKFHVFQLMLIYFIVVHNDAHVSLFARFEFDKKKTRYIYPNCTLILLKRRKGDQIE